MIKLTKNRNIGRIKKVLIMIFLFSFIFMGIASVSPGNMQNNEDIRENLLISPLTAEVHSKISIVGDTALDDFCDGNGTDGSSWANAHVIKDYEIDMGGSDNSIDIRDTTLYLIIKNCIVTNSDGSGIYLDNCTNVKITGCNSSFNSYYGIYLRDSHDCIFTGNNFSNNDDFGFYFDNSNYTTILGNNISHNDEAGIYLEESSNNTLSGNNVSNNSVEGIFLYYFCDNNTISENNISNNSGEGIYLYNLCVNNTISGNNVSYNDNGIYLGVGSKDTSILGNDLSFNADCGISLSEGDNTSIFGNNVSFNQNGINIGGKSQSCQIWMNFISNNSNYQGSESTLNSHWDNSTVGNYWGDYQDRYPDASAIGNIWDTNYTIYGFSNNNDTKPLVNVDPIIDLLPSNNVKYLLGETGHLISWTITDTYYMNPEYYIYHDDFLVEEGNWVSGDSVSLNVDGLDVGTYSFRIVVYDGTAWGKNENTIEVEVEVIPKPVIITISQTISTENITVEWSEVVGVDSYNVYINGTLTYPTDNLTQNIWLNESGTYLITVTAINGAEESEHSDAITIIVLIDDSNNNLFWYLFGGGWLLVAGFIGIAFVKVKMKK